MDVIVMHANSEKMPLKIRACHLEQMRRHADHVYYFKNEEELLASGADAEVLFAWGGTGKQPETFCRQSRRLKWFNSFSAGVNPLMECGIKDLDIIITNAAGIHGKPMGVTTMGYVISYLRKFPLMLENQKKHIRQKPDALPEEPEGKTLGIVGAGAIGSEVAKYAKTLEEMGANSICIKDMAGLLTPYTCYDLVKKLKETVSIPVDIHSHYTAGLASMSILKGIEAGADIIDTAMSPLSLGTSHMPTESLVAALQGTDYDTGLDLKQLNVVRAYFAKLREKYIANGQISPKSLGVDANTLLYQVPGGMFSNMLKQLKDAGKEDKLDEVLAEIPRVREDAGYPPLVTPTSQIVGTQAVFNVIMGERYKMVTKEFKGLVHGDYGKTPAPIKPEFTKKILGDEQPITCRFADTLAPEMDKLKAEAAKWATQEEDVLTYAMFPQVAPKFFDKRNAKKQGVDGDHVDYTNQSHPV